MRGKLLALALMLLLLTAGCGNTGSPSNTDSPALSQAPAPSSPAPQGDTPVELTADQRDVTLYNLLSVYAGNGSLTNNWQGTPVPVPENELIPQNFAVRGAVQHADGSYTVTTELLATVYLQTDTMTDSLDGTRTVAHTYSPLAIQSQGLDCSPMLPVGRAEVQVSTLADDAVLLACSYTPYPTPGLAYLKAQTETLAPKLAASTKLDTAQYDAALVNYIWRQLATLRYIEQPTDITLYDLESYRGTLWLNYSELDLSTEPPVAPVDGSLLRLMPNVETMDVTVPLQDYSIFEPMQGLKKLTLDGLTAEQLATLRVGHTDRLSLQDFQFDVLDLTAVNADTLSLTSWSRGITGFKGCDKVQSLYINSTRTDMQLVNADSFPNATYLNLQFFSDTPRVRDFSQLATFPNVPIDLMLGYQACNNKTVASLAGVPLRLLVLNPKDGSYPLNEPDPALVKAVPAKNTIWGQFMYFEERTLETE